MIKNDKKTGVTVVTGQIKAINGKELTVNAEYDDVQTDANGKKKYSKQKKDIVVVSEQDLSGLSVDKEVAVIGFQRGAGKVMAEGILASSGAIECEGLVMVHGWADNCKLGEFTSGKKQGEKVYSWQVYAGKNANDVPKRYTLSVTNFTANGANTKKTDACQKAFANLGKTETVDGKEVETAILCTALAQLSSKNPVKEWTNPNTGKTTLYYNAYVNAYETKEVQLAKERNANRAENAQGNDAPAAEEPAVEEAVNELDFYS